MIPTLYLDESGFTGVDLLNPAQTVFVAASNVLSTADAEALLADTIGPLAPGAAEHSHSSLVSSSKGRQRLIRFFEQLVKYRVSEAAYYAANKRFALLAKLIDNWVEPAMYRDGFDLYAEGGGVAYLNMMFFCLRGFEGEDRFNQLLQAYQDFSRDATNAGFDRFFSTVDALMASSEHPSGADLLGNIFYGSSLGCQHLQWFDDAAHDVAYPIVFSTIAHWNNVIGQPFAIVHDSSTNVAKVHWMLEAVLDPDINERRVVAFDGTLSYELPFRATGFTFGASENHPQLQVSDLIAGASAAVGRFVVDNAQRPDYAKALISAGIESLSIGQIWPDADDIARKRPLPATGAGNPIVETGRLVMNAKRRRGGT